MPALQPDPVRAERYLRRALGISSAVAALLVLAQAVAMVWARHELVPYESVVAIHVSQLAAGVNLYHPLDGYPYTVSTYPPLFHALAGGLCRLGAPAFQAGRVVSLLGFAGVLVFVWRLLGYYTRNRYARWTGTLLAASTANLVFWGTVCRVDMLGLFFSLAAFDRYSRYRADQQPRRLVLAALLVVAAAFSKQTMLVSGAVIGILLLRENWRRAALFGGVTAGLGLGVALALNYATAGNFLAHTVRSNLNPFSGAKFADQLRYLALAGNGLLVLAACGARAAWRERWQPLYLYLGAAAVVLLATGAKVGADLQYQLETLVLLALAAGWTLDRLEFFPRLFAGDRALVTLLQLPLALHLVVNLTVSAKTVVERVALESLQRQSYAALQPYLAASPDPLLSAYQDALVQSGRPLVVDPFMFSLIAHGNLIDPEPLRRDLENGKFGLVILYEDVFENAGRPQNLEYEDLPPAHLEAIRHSYRLVAHLPGAPLDTYLYQPRGTHVSELRSERSKLEGLRRLAPLPGGESGPAALGLPGCCGAVRTAPGGRAVHVQPDYAREPGPPL